MSGCLRKVIIGVIDLLVIVLLIAAAYLVYDHFYGVGDLQSILQPLSTLSAPFSTSSFQSAITSPPPTPTPGLFSGSPDGYLPELQDLPEGFDLLSEGQAVVPIPEQGTPSMTPPGQYDSYQKEYLAADVSRIGVVLSLRFLIFLYPTNLQAADGYHYMDLDRRLAGLQVNQTLLEDVEEQALFFDLNENLPNPETPEAACIGIFQKRNALVTVMATSLLSSDQETSKHNLLSDCIYYAKLIDGKLK